MQLIKFIEVSSTNDVAIELAKKGAKHFTCIVAERQTAGRGRRGKIWTTLPNKSIACSVILRGNVSPLLPLIASLAVYKTVSKYVKCSIKWPNDILISGKKVSGILAEKVGSGHQSFYILGVGLNVQSFKISELEGVLATSVEEESGLVIQKSVILQELLSHLKACLLKDKICFLKEYRQSCATIGQKVTWKSDKTTLTGIAKNITEQGSLLLDVHGEIHEIMSGEIVAQGCKN